MHKFVLLFLAAFNISCTTTNIQNRTVAGTLETEFELLLNSVTRNMSDDAKLKRSELKNGESMIEYEYAKSTTHDDTLIINDLEARITTRSASDGEVIVTGFMNFVPSTRVKNQICQQLGYLESVNSDLGINRTSEGRIFNDIGLWGFDSIRAGEYESRASKLYKRAESFLKGHPVRFEVIKNAAYLKSLVCSR